MNVAIQAMQTVDTLVAFRMTADSSLMAKDSLISVQRYEIITARATAGDAHRLLTMQEDLTTIAVRRGWKWFFISLGIALTWIAREVVF